MASSEAIKNGIRNMLDLTFLEDRARARPSVQSVAVSSVCDLKCPHCMRESLGVRENQFMDFDRLAAHAEELKTARRITLFGLGEPFLHPRFFDFLALAKSLGVWVSTSTHGMSLKPEVREKILESGLDELNISMDGADKVIFDELRVGAEFNTVVANVTAMAELRNSRGIKAPVMNVNMTVMRRNLHQVPLMVRLAKQMGAESVSFSSGVVYKQQDADTSVVDTPEFEETMEAGRRLAERLGIGMSFWRQKPFGWLPDAYDPGSSYGCVVLWSDQIIDRDGMVKMCCYIEEDAADAFKLGPVAAFNADPVAKQRRALMEGRVRNECQGCMYLRERTPSWIQAHLNEAMRRTTTDDGLNENDRKELLAEISAYQARKDDLFPLHRFRKAGELAWAVADSHADSSPMVY